MFKLETHIRIAASAGRVWSILSDYNAYPQWNPFIRSIRGPMQVGGQLNLLIQPQGTSSMRFKPTVLAAAREREFRWKGRLLLPGLFDGEHEFLIEPDADGVIFHQRERFSGILVPLFRKSLDRGTRQGFEAMNQALKELAERP